MKVKTYRAPTMKQALEEIKKDLGPDAFILSGKEIKPKKILGVFGKRVFEVTAAVDHGNEEELSVRTPALETEKSQDHVQFSEEAVKRGNSSKPAHAPVELSPVVSELLPPVGIQTMLDEIRSLKNMIQARPESSVRSRPAISRMSHPFSHTICAEVYADLVSRGLDEELAHDLISGTAHRGSAKTPAAKAALKRKAAMTLTRRLKVAKDLIKERPGKGPRVIAFVGPTGVGKTTTLAKLAARAVLEDQLDVGLITLDTFRIAAIEQLKTYAEIIGIPTKVVETIPQMRGAIEEFGSKDLILIDTAGRGHRELGAQPEIAQFFSQSRHIHKSLVLSATTKQTDLSDLMKRYTIFGPNSVIVTKLDETETYGQLFNELLRAGQPLAYVTVGQNVPRDILNPNPGKLVSLTLGMGDVTWETFVGMPTPTRPVSTRGHRKAIELCAGAR